MAKYPNQRTVKIISSSGRKKDEIDTPCGIITRQEEQIAFRILDDKRNTTPIMLFLHLALNKNGYIFDFSPAQLQEQFGISADRWRCAFNTLVKKGYIVQESNQKNHYIFYSLPTQYKNITFCGGEIEKESEIPPPVTIPADRDSIPPPQDNIPADKDSISPPTGIGYPRRQVEDTPTDRDSNNKYIINNKLENEKNKLIEIYNSEFGHLEDSPLELINVETKATRNIGNYSNKTEKQIKLLKELIDKMRKKKDMRNHSVRFEYQKAIESTLPKDIYSRIKVNLILDKFISKYNSKEFPVKMFRERYGVWVNGWNEEVKEPNIIIAQYQLPLSVVRKQRHNIDGIPKEYYSSKG